MSTYLVGEESYECSGCDLGGCLGHKLQVFMNCSVDAYVIYVDGKHRESFDEDYLHAVIRCIDKKTCK
jgi:hypothetical protein